MAAFTTEEGNHALQDGHQVYTKTWKPSTTPKALVLFIHGFSDHVNNTYTFFPTLASRGIQTHAFDQRGWGRSVHKPAQKGLSGPTKTVMNDITSMLRFLLPIAAETSTPLFLMGHSMGGAEVLYYAATGPAEIRAQLRGYLALSPYLALHPAAQPSRVVEFVGRLAMKVLPGMHMVQKLSPTTLCRDPTIAENWDKDPLCHDTGTLEQLGGMMDRGVELDKDVVRVTEGRVFVAHGTEDRVTWYDTTKRWFDRLQVEDKTMKTYEGWFHVLFAEPGEDKITFANDVADWILTKSNVRQSDAQSKL